MDLQDFQISRQISMIIIIITTESFITIIILISIQDITTNDNAISIGPCQ